MADDNTYHIYVHGNSSEGGQASSVVSGQTQNTTEEIKTPEMSKTSQGAMRAVKGMVSYGAVRAFANNLISYELSQVNLRTGAAEYEQKLQFGYEMANKAINIGTATITGAMAGGPVGAIVGLLGSTMYTLIGYAQNYNTIQTKQTLENISLGMASQRAGISGRRGANQ